MHIRGRLLIDRRSRFPATRTSSRRNTARPPGLDLKPEFPGRASIPFQGFSDFLASGFPEPAASGLAHQLKQNLVR